MELITEYRADDWNISKIDPETSGKYVFDYMDLGRDHCQNCGHPINWCVHIHDAEEPAKTFIVGDDCIEFLLNMRGCLENEDELKQFREAKRVLVRFFHWLMKHGTDGVDLSDVVGFVNTNQPSSGVTVEFIQTTTTTAGYQTTRTTKDGRLYRPFLLTCPDFALDKWIHFFPRLKEVLVGYESSNAYGGYFITANNAAFFTEKASNAMGCLRRSFRYEDDCVEKENETEIGPIKAIKLDYYTKYLVNDRVFDPYSHRAPNLGCLWSDTLKPLFPECKLDLSTFLSVQKNNTICRNACSEPQSEEFIKKVEQAKKQQADKEEERRHAEEEKKRREEAKKSFYDTIVANPTAIIDGMSGNCIPDYWVARFREPLKKIIGDKITEKREKNPGDETATIVINNCTTKFKLKFKEQIERLKSMSEYSRARYLENIILKLKGYYHTETHWSVKKDNTTFSYHFKPTNIKDAPNDEAYIIGYVEIRVIPVFNTTTNTPINENTKITLSIGQLKKLVAECNQW